MASVCVLSAAASSLSAAESSNSDLAGLRCQVLLASRHHQVGKPILARFLIENTSDEPITLTVPGTEPDLPSPEMGLPLTHVFSGGSSSGVTITTHSRKRWTEPVGFRRRKRAPILMIAPHSSVGMTVDLLSYFPVLRGSGEYKVTWRPYNGQLQSETVDINIAPLKVAYIDTDDGVLTLRFLYKQAPLSAANFIGLARSGFYDGLTFHRLETGYFIQSGCPRGDGTGIRSDGVRIPAELSDHPLEKGSVAMALLDGDLDSASCQFFICNTRQKSWDGKYTVFAELFGEESMETLDKLMSTPVDENGRPVRTLYIRSIRIVDADPSFYPDAK